MNWKLFSILILNFNIIFSATCIIKNDGIAKIFVVDPNSGFAISLEPTKSGTIDNTLKGLKKLFVNETLNFFEQEHPNSETYKLKYQLRDNDFMHKTTELSYNQIKQLANQPNQEFVITAFK